MRNAPVTPLALVLSLGLLPGPGCGREVEPRIETERFAIEGGGNVSPLVGRRVSKRHLPKAMISPDAKLDRIRSTAFGFVKTEQRIAGILYNVLF